MFLLKPLENHRFEDFDHLMAFATKERNRTSRIPLKGLWREGARFHDDATFGTGAASYRFNSESFRTVCNYVGAYDETLQILRTPGLATVVLNDLAQHKIGSLGEKSEPELVVDEESKTVIGLVSTRYVGYSNEAFINDVLHAISGKPERELFPDLGGLVLREAYSVNARIYLRLVSKTVQGRISGKGGTGDDVSEVGVELRNSMAGGSAVKLAWFVYRLLCKNGLVVRAGSREGRVIHSGSETEFRRRLYAESVGIIAGLKTAKQMIETLGALPFDPHKLAKHADLSMIYGITSDRDLRSEARRRIDGRESAEMNREARVLRRAADELSQIPECLGGPESLAVFRSYWRDGASMYDFVNIFTEYAKSLPIAERVEVDSKAGKLATWIAANRRKFR
jgi:hypothetical protein